MRNFILFFIRYHVIITFVGLQVLCFYWLYQSRSFQRWRLNEVSTAISGKVYEQVAVVQGFFELRRENEVLRTENAQLRNQLQESMYTKMDWHDSDSTWEAQFQYAEARVISNSITKRNNHFTINQGKKAGIKSGMGVMNHEGVVGIVKSVSDHYALCISLLSSEAKISAQIKDTEYFGTVTWPGSKSRIAMLSDIPDYAQCKTGDTLVTNEFSAIFPKGIPVGTIKEITTVPGRNFYTIQIELFTQFNRLNSVYVINNKRKDEKLELESTIKE
jgi:rod shape-determining protein MreC